MTNKLYSKDEVIADIEENFGCHLDLIQVNNIKVNPIYENISFTILFSEFYKSAIAVHKLNSVAYTISDLFDDSEKTNIQLIEKYFQEYQRHFVMPRHDVPPDLSKVTVYKTTIVDGTISHCDFLMYEDDKVIFDTVKRINDLMIKENILIVTIVLKEGRVITFKRQLQ